MMMIWEYSEAPQKKSRCFNCNQLPSVLYLAISVMGDVTIKGTITHLTSHRIRNGNLMIEAIVADVTGSVRCVWFSKNLMKDILQGSEYVLNGKYELKYGRMAIHKPKYKATGEHPSTQYLSNAPLATPKRDYPHYTKQKQTFIEEYRGLIGFWSIALLIAVFIFWPRNHISQPIPVSPPDTTSSINNASTRTYTPTLQTPNTTRCIDVTSYDHNWNNDVLCTRPDGSTFYTDYAGGRSADSTFER
jgi:hypothetical protein